VSNTCALPAQTPLDSHALPTPEQPPKPQGRADASVALVKLAVARSGDKGNHSNIGVLPRPGIPAVDRRSADAGGHRRLDAPRARPDPRPGRTRYLPGTHSLNFLLENALGGGGVASLRIDPQARPSPSNCWKSPS
jgi:hypothetical protein